MRGEVSFLVIIIGTVNFFNLVLSYRWRKNYGYGDVLFVLKTSSCILCFLCGKQSWTEVYCQISHSKVLLYKIKIIIYLGWINLHITSYTDVVVVSYFDLLLKSSELLLSIFKEADFTCFICQINSRDKDKSTIAIKIYYIPLWHFNNKDISYWLSMPNWSLMSLEQLNIKPIINN